MPLALRAFLGLLLALVPAGVVQALLEREAYVTRTEQAAEQATRLVLILSRQQAGILSAGEQTLAAMAAHYAASPLQSNAECDEFLARMIRASPRYRTAKLFDPQGRSLCAAGPVAEVNVADQRYFRAVLADGGFHVGDHAVGRGSGQPTLPMATSLRDDAAALRGVVAVGLSLDWLARELAGLALPPGASALVAGSDGVVLASSREAERFVGLPLPEFAMEFLRAPAPGTVNVLALDGVRRVTAFIPAQLGPGGLFLSVGLDAERVFAEEIYSDRRQAVMIVGSLMLSFLLALVAFQVGIERPVRRLLAAAQRWRQDEWHARVGTVGGGREFVRLGNAFDAMAAAVEAREAAVLHAATRMIAVQEVAPQIVLTADRNGAVDWANPYWHALTGQSEAERSGEGWLDALAPEGRAAAARAWQIAVAEATAGGAPFFEREVRIRRHVDGAERWFLLRGAPVPGEGGSPRAWALVGVDVDALHEARLELIGLAAQLHATYENAPAGLCLLDRDLRFVAINDMMAQANAMSVAEHLGRPLAEVAPHVADRLGPAMRQVLATGKPVTDLEVSGMVGVEERFWLCNIHPVFGAPGDVTGVSAAVIDITARRRVEESERQLSREVDHRAQNALSVVRGLVRLSAADAPDDVSALVEVLEGRVAAMSRAHNVLSREKWVAADLREIVMQELAPHSSRTTIEGPSLRLRAEGAQPLTLVVHEMATNALKYGALSRPDGHVAVQWRLDNGGVRLCWTERGGPRIDGPPPRFGFGQQLIDANLHAQLDGRIERHWEPDGFRAVVFLGPEALAGRSPGFFRADAVLAGRRVLLALDDQAEALALATALRESGCEVVGPAETPEQAQALLERVGAVDAAVLSGTLRGSAVRPVAQMLRRRTTAVFYLSDVGVAPEELALASLLPRPITGRTLSAAIIAALRRGDAAAASVRFK